LNCQHTAPLASAHIAEIYAVIDASADETPVRKLSPVAGAEDPAVSGTHVKLAVGVAAKGILFFEPDHDDLVAVLSEKWL
jgi:hypothetical protein